FRKLGVAAEEEAGFAVLDEAVVDPGKVSSDHWKAVRHRLRHHRTESLEVRREGHDVRCLEIRVWIGHLADEDDAMLEPFRLDELPHGLDVVGFERRAYQQQVEIGPMSQQFREHPDLQHRILSLAKPSDEY